ncbi:hypothetical protein Holit_01876 [Hollandina sp. SP2]
MPSSDYTRWNIPASQTTLVPLAATFEAYQNPNRGKLDPQKKHEARKSLEDEEAT